MRQAAPSPNIGLKVSVVRFGTPNSEIERVALLGKRVEYPTPSAR
jgi:hypothetical protein